MIKSARTSPNAQGWSSSDILAAFALGKLHAPPPAPGLDPEAVARVREYVAVSPQYGPVGRLMAAYGHGGTFADADQAFVTDLRTIIAMAPPADASQSADITVEGDDRVIEMARILHSHLPEDQRPMARMDFSDDQWARMSAAFEFASQSAEVERVGSGVYVASRASIPERGEMWRALRASGVPINSTWIDEDGPKASRDLCDLWTRINREVTSAERLILYVEPDDFPLKGALVEVGMALGAGVPIVIVAPHVRIDGRNCRPFGSWIKHPTVSFAPTVRDALPTPPATETEGG